MDRLEWLIELTASRPEDAQSWYWLGMEHMNQGNTVQAISAFTEGIKHADELLRAQLITELSRSD